MNVKGWKTVQTISDKGITVRTNGEFVNLNISKSGVTTTAWSIYATINSAYAPYGIIRFNKNGADSEADNTHLYLESNGKIACPSAFSNKNLSIEVLYKLNNPLY